MIGTQHWDLSALLHCGGCGTWEGLGFPGEGKAEGVAGEMGGANF